MVKSQIRLSSAELAMSMFRHRWLLLTGLLPIKYRSALICGAIIGRGPARVMCYNGSFPES